MTLETFLNPNTEHQERELAQESLWIAQARLDRQVFAGLYDRYFPRVYNYLRLRCADGPLADDLTAQVFERALTHLDSYDPEEGTFAAWLFGIARNALYDHLRRQRRQNWLSLGALRRDPQPANTPEEALIQSERRLALLHALQTLSERERDLLALKFTGEMSNRQIAGLVGLSESHVGVVVFRALGRLRAILQSQAGKEI